MPLGIPQATTATEVNIYVSTANRTVPPSPGTEQAGLAGGIGAIINDTGFFTTYFANGQNMRTHVLADGSSVVLPLNVNPVYNPVVRVTVTGTTGGGTAVLNATRFV